MATVYKDFGKEVKDILTKNVAEGKEADKKLGGFPLPIWKVESKLKTGKDKCVVVNPIADKNGVTAAVEFTADCVVPGVAGKLVLADGGVTAWSPTLSYSCCGRKLEVTTKDLVAPVVDEKDATILVTEGNRYNVDATYEDKQKEYTAVVKFVAAKREVSTEVSAPVTVPGLPGDLTVGGTFVFPASTAFGFSKWGAGLRYKPCKSFLVAAVVSGSKVTTDKDGKKKGGLSQIDVSVGGDIPGVELEGKPVQVGVAVTGKADEKSGALGWTTVLGLTGKTPACPLGSSWKVKADTAKNVSASLNMALSGWNVAGTFDFSNKLFGITATLE